PRTDDLQFSYPSSAPPPPRSPLFPYTTLFRSRVAEENARVHGVKDRYQTLAGDAFKVDFGDAYDVALVTNFLHHFDQEIGHQRQDRKITRLNSSHLGISYAVFCLKKKNKMQNV